MADKNINENASEFMLRTGDILADAKHRTLDVINPKEIKEILSGLGAIKEEAAAAQTLKGEQGHGYAKLTTEIKDQNSQLTGMPIELPRDVTRDLAAIDEQKRTADKKAVKTPGAEEEYQPEPE